MTNIYAYGLDDRQKTNLKNLLKEYAFNPVFWDDRHLSQVVGYLVGLPNFEAKEEEVWPSEEAFLLFQDLPREQGAAFLTDLREQVGYFPFKANLTESNSRWLLRDLIHHNQEEHRVMRLYGNLVQVFPVAESLLKEKEDEKLKQALENAKGYLQPREFDFEELRGIYNELAVEVNRLLQEAKDSE